jgi:hypothetical protein
MEIQTFPWSSQQSLAKYHVKTFASMENLVKDFVFEAIF